MKLKTKTTERTDIRYVLVNVDKKNKIEESIKSFCGSLGLSQISPLFVEPMKEKLEKNDLIVSIRRESLDLFRAALEINKEEIKIKKVSGTLKGLFS